MFLRYGVIFFKGDREGIDTQLEHTIILKKAIFLYLGTLFVVSKVYEGNRYVSTIEG